MTASWVLRFSEIDDSAVQSVLDELISLFRRGLLTPEDISRVVDILGDSEVALTGGFRDFRSDPATRTGEARIYLEPSHRLVDLVAAIRTRPANTAALTDV